MQKLWCNICDNCRIVLDDDYIMVEDMHFCCGLCQIEYTKSDEFEENYINRKIKNKPLDDVEDN